MNIKLSLVIPVYNCEKYIESCVKSVQSKEKDNFEIIIVDDCSTDSSFKVCYELSEQNHRIRVLQTRKNGGATQARLLGIEESNGEYIGFIDADDYVCDSYVDEIISSMDSYFDIIGFGCLLENDNGELKSSGASPRGGVYDRQAIRKSIFPKLISDGDGHAIPNNLWRLVYKKELAEQVMKQVDPRIIIGEDEIFVKTCMARANVVLMIDKDLYCHRFNPNSLTKSRRVREFNETHLKYHNMVFLLQDSDYDFSDQFNRELILTFYNIAALKFNAKGKSYLEIRKEIIDELRNPLIKNAIKNARFNITSSNYLKYLVLRFRLIYLMKLRATK